MVIVSPAPTDRTQSPCTGWGGIEAVAIEPANTPVFAAVSAMTSVSLSPLDVVRITVMWSIAEGLRLACGIETVKKKTSPMLIVLAGTTAVFAIPAGAAAARIEAEEAAVAEHCAA